MHRRTYGPFIEHVPEDVRHHCSSEAHSEPTPPSGAVTGGLLSDPQLCSTPGNHVGPSVSNDTRWEQTQQMLQ